MLEEKTLLMAEDEKIDLSADGWDDRLVSFLREKSGLDQSKAESIAQFLKDQLRKIDLKVVTISMIEKIIEAKLIEYGIVDKATIKLDKSIFKDTRLPLTENALRVLKKRYLKTDENGNIIETPEDMFRRVAHHIALAEEKYGASAEEVKKMEEIFYKMMTELKFLPNSPTLMNAGRELGQLAACFVLPVEDSMEGIFDALKYAALIHKSGGGTGFSFSRLRPKNSRVGSTGGVASGPVSFMKIFNTATEQVKQGGTRRGANMAILRVDHPDIMEFIYSKKDTNELNNFNISVAVTDKFMKAVQEGTNYDLIDPRTGKKAGELNAREVYKAMIECAWETGDPGIVFIDRINEDNPTPELGEIESTNPCVVGDTLVVTDKGLIEARNLKKGMKVWDGKGWNKIEKVINNGVRKIYKVTLRSGLEIRVTAEHKFMTEHGWREVKDLKIHDKVFVPLSCPEMKSNKSKDEIEFFELIGYFIGDGSLSNSNHVSLHTGGDLELVNYFSPILKRYAGSSYIISRENQFIIDTHVKQFADKIREIFGIETSKSIEKEIPAKFLSEDTEAIKALLRGIFSSDGTVYESNGTVTVALSSSSKKLLKQVQILLLYLGIPTTLTKTNSTYRILISGERVNLFLEKVGFIGKKKEKIFEFTKNKNTYSTLKRYEYQEIISIEEDGEEEVFDITAPPNYTWITNGILSMDCGEQPLLPYEACNLGSINLAKFVVKGEDGRPKIDYEALKETVWYAVRFLDNVIDMSKYPLPKIEEMVRGNRKIGLGVMGFADVLFQLMIPYDSEEALLLAEEIMSFIQKEAHEASKALAKERGVFPNFEKSIYKDKPDCRYRNATVTTIAPTGTLSIIAGCSSGIEPVFALCFVRNVMDNDKLLEVNPYFEKIAKERGFYSKELMERIAEKGSIQDMEEIPEDVRRVFVTAHDIAPEWHVRMQAAFQKYTDNAVSKTVNLPRDATVEDVKKVYDLAYKLRLKGITIYRDGSKQNQVLTLVKDTKKEKEGVWVKERPETLPGFTTKVTTGMGNLYITVTEYEGKPFEVFAIIGKSGRSTTAKTEAIGRLISLCLRAGVSVEEIVDQLKGIGGEYPVFQKNGLVLSIPDAIARVLEKRYLRGDKKQKKTKKTFQIDLKGERCPECGEKLSFEEGCMKCYSCGFSSC